MRCAVAAARSSAAILLFTGVLRVLAAAPDIDSVSPLTIRPGVPAEITLSGSGLDGAPALWTSFPASVEPLGGGRFKILTEAAVGPGVLRVFGTNGISGPGFVFLDDLPAADAPKTNNARASAQPIAFGSAVDGRATELGYNWFKLRLAKGQRVSLETVASRLGSKLDSVLRVENSAGRELARNDDAPGLSGDSHVNLTAPESGDYFIELRDVNYGGGSAFFYHLRVGDFPLITTAFPPFAGQGSSVAFQLAGSANETSRMKSVVPTNGAARLANKGRAGSSFAQAFGSAAREFVEKEPNDVRANAVAFGDGLNGRFDKPGDRDVFQFTAGKGERVEFRASTRSLGSACDAVLRLESAHGKRLAGSNPSATDEGVLTYSFPSNGTYRLAVEEASGASGSHLVYHIATQQSGFGLSLETEHVNGAPGKTFELKVTAARAEFKGAVTLAVDGPSGPLAVTNHVIAEGKTNATMKVTVPDSFLPGTWHRLTVRGTAKRDGREISARASTAPAWRKQLPLMLHPSPEFEGVLVLGVTAAK